MSHPLRWYQLQLSKIQVEFLILVYSVLVLTLGFQFKAVHKATNIFQASLALVFFWLLMAEKHAQREFVYIFNNNPPFNYIRKYYVIFLALVWLSNMIWFPVENQLEIVQQLHKFSKLNFHQNYLNLMKICPSFACSSTLNCKSHFCFWLYVKIWQIHLFSKDRKQNCKISPRDY